MSFLFEKIDEKKNEKQNKKINRTFAEAGYRTRRHPFLTNGSSAASVTALATDGVNSTRGENPAAESARAVPVPTAATRMPFLGEPAAFQPPTKTEADSGEVTMIHS